MNDKVLPLRKCVACNKMVSKDGLYRLAKVDGKLFLDLTFKAQGRGAYVCRSRECVDIAVKKKSFNRSLKCAVDEEVIKQIYMELENGSR